MKFLVLLMCFFAVPAFATERDHEFSVGVTGGLAPESPWARDDFKKTTHFWNSRVGAFGRFHLALPEAVAELAYDRFDFSQSEMGVDAFTLGLLWRFRPDANIHPVFQVAGGIAQTQRYFGNNKVDLSVFKIRAGAELELRHQLDLAFYFDHFTVFKTEAGKPNIHVLAPTLATIYYFNVPHNTKK